jgi:putative membrane protein
MMDGWNMTGWGWGWMSLFPVLFVIAVALVVRLLMSGSGSGRTSEREDSAREVLRHRFAAGEIDEDEFNRRRASLERTSNRDST